MTDLVADDPVDAGEIRRQAEAAGLNWSTVKRAKRALGIESQKQGFDGRWKWSISPKGPKGTKAPGVVPSVPSGGMGPFEKGEPPTASAGNNSEKDGSREPVLPLDPFDGPGDPAGAWKDRDV